MKTNLSRLMTLCVFSVFASTSAVAQLVVYDDDVRNGFANYSYGGGSSFIYTPPLHGTYSISLTGSFNAISFDHPAATFTTAQYPTLDFWVRGAAGGEQIQVILQNSTLPPANQVVWQAPLGSVTTTWTEVQVVLGHAPNAYSGAFDRIDLQSSSMNSQTFYIDDVTLLPPGGGPPVSTMQIVHDTTVQNLLSDQFTWQDSNLQPRVAVLAHNDAGTDHGAAGGALREFRYQLPNGAQRVATITTYGNGGYAGFGYVVSHQHGSTCNGDDSPLGGFTAGNWQRVFEGRHHAIFRFTQNYPRNCAFSGATLNHTIPVVMDWIFSTGRDNPIYAITWNIDQASPAVIAGTFYDDSRAPYGELNIDGEGFTDIDGVAWGDRYKFTSTGVTPLTLKSSWTWNVANTVPYIKEWIAGPLGAGNNKDATMGLVQTQTLTQQDAAGARDPNFHDVTPFWGKTSANGNAGGAYSMPYQDDWPYQANADNMVYDPGTDTSTSNNNARMTWRTQYGFIGQSAYDRHDGALGTAPGYPKKSYATYVVLGTHSNLPVEAQVAQVEAIQNVSLTINNAIGSVVTTGPAGAGRADNVTYQPAGYNHVYGALAFSTPSNQLDANIAVAAGTLKKPLIIISNFTSASYPVVKLAGITLTSDVDYFPSLRASASELWITLNRDLTGNTNHFEILGPVGVPAAPTNVVATATAPTQIDLSWDPVVGVTFQIDRKGPGGAYTQIATPGTNSYSDTTALANTAYVYRVRAVNGSGPSANSAPDLATTIFFTDTPLNGVAIKALHLSQIRAAIDAVRTLAGTAGGAPYTDGTAGTTVKAVHINELRTVIDAARAALGLPTPAYTDVLANGVTVKAIHFQELRARVQ